MFEFSSKTQLNRQFKLSDLFRQMNASRDVKKGRGGNRKGYFNKRNLAKDFELRGG